ncbi:serine hydrolase domain-containing protein [Inquilinus sp.]|jgi:CubicO group peptidase (beta-lactamase class C family)|uniref:serine hydrolase domain-containing protein n=1 Tax=Inquilinus sp. TaxID=1932117 RepID=UPI0037833655
MSLETLADHAFAPVALALEDGRIPGAALGIATADGQRALRWGGVATTLPKPEPLARDTWFDLASLTKVIVTVTEILRLVEEGVLDLDDPLAKHLPDAAPLHGAITLRRLIDHSSGLPAQERIYLWPGPADQRRAAVIRKHWPVKAEPVYSDINYMLLGFVVERWRGVAFSQLPVGTGLSFAPVPAQSAATEVCAVRNRLLRGEVHDENAWSLGGAAGHAGLFGTVRGVLDFALELLRGRLLSPAAMVELCAPQSTPGRALGWERRHPGWKGGSLCSPRTIGHLGFTGTGLWIDLDRGIAWTLLTNRVHPSREVDTGIQDLRLSVGNRIAARWRDWA